MNENFVSTHILMNTIVDIDVETRLYAFISGLYAIVTRIVQKMMMKRVHVNGSGMEQTIYLCGGRYFGDCGMERGIEYDGRQDLLCDLIDQRSNELWLLNQRKESSSSILPQNQLERRSLNEINYSKTWTCSRGIYVCSIKDSLGFACLCPDYYYGDRCQYQRKRTSVELYM